VTDDLLRGVLASAHVDAGAVLARRATAAGLVFALYLVYVQVALIGASCEWCLASDALLTVLVPLTLARLRACTRHPALAA
jgi:uncharacterized membrane protein